MSALRRGRARFVLCMRLAGVLVAVGDTLVLSPAPPRMAGAASPHRSRRRSTWLGSGANFSPDGQRIVFERRAHGVPNPFAMNSDGSHLRQLTHEKHKTFAIPEPAWQPLPSAP